MDLRPAYELPANVKVMFNIGACLDITTGTWMVGKNGENILNGGLAYVTGMVGIGNNFKTTITHYMNLAAWNRVQWVCKTSYTNYDTEVNAHESRGQHLAQRMDQLRDLPLFEERHWQITDKTVYYANTWFDKTKEFLVEKRKIDKKQWLRTPFANRDQSDYLYMIPPTFALVDSLSELYSEAESKMLDNNELGDSGGNTFHMRAGLVKTRLLMEIPALAGGSSHYISLTAQLGKDIPIASGPMPAPPTKKLQYLKNGDKIKGATDKFTFATNNCWHAYNAAPLVNQSTKAAEYPRGGVDPLSGDTDLNVVKLRQLRSKSGTTGIELELIVSQTDGVLPELTEFHFIKSADRFGISGTLQHYVIDLYPECKIQRTTVRDKLDSDPKLCRAVNIVSEMAQMKWYMSTVWEEYGVDPKELYTSLKAKGYDWDEILQTRGWWTFNNDDHPIPFLSSMDLLKIHKGEYEGPYKSGWLSKVKGSSKIAVDADGNELVTKA